MTDTEARRVPLAMLALIGALEKATEGSRELDAKIWVAVLPRTGKGIDGDGLPEGPYYYEYDAEEDGSVNMYVAWKNSKKRPLRRARRHSMPYTTSLDTALTLVPDKMFVELRRYSDGWYAFVAPRSTTTALAGHVGEQKPVALALCIAALKARSAQGMEARRGETPLGGSTAEGGPVQEEKANE